jgi:hypothetical protein
MLKLKGIDYRVLLVTVCLPCMDRQPVWCPSFSRLELLTRNHLESSNSISRRMLNAGLY